MQRVRWGRRTLALSFVVGLTALAAPQAASAQGVLDANCPGPETISFPSGDDARWAETFTALTSGSLVRAETEIGKSGPAGDFAMQILATDAAGDPTNTVLASTTIPDAFVPTGNSRIAGLFATPASVVAGEQYAFVITRPGEEFTIRDRGDNPCPAGAEYLSPSQTAAFGGADTCCDLIFAVFVEPPAAPNPQPEVGDTTAPDATITKHPKAKTEKKQATFEFTSSESGSSFECSLNGAAFTSCASPDTVKAKKGKNSFAVRAKDAAGNLDASPATFDWKVKKKKRK
jgi:hypothetical protein